jgi:hypothetical protein
MLVRVLMRRDLIAGLVGALLCAPVAGLAQERTRPARIGVNLKRLGRAVALRETPFRLWRMPPRTDALRRTETRDRSGRPR